MKNGLDSSNWSLFQKDLILNFDNQMFSMVMSLDGNILVTGGIEDRSIKVWELQNGAIRNSWITDSISHIKDANRIYTLSISQDNKILVTGGSLIQSWNLENAKKMRTFKGSGWALYSNISPDGTFLVTYNEDRTTVWNLATGKRIRTRWGDPDVVRCLLISPDSKTLIGGDGRDQKIKVWELISGKVIYSLESSTKVRVHELALSSDGEILAGAGHDGIQFWSYKTGKCLHSINKFNNLNFHQHLDNVFCPTFSSDGQFLLTSGYDGVIQVWDVYRGKHIYSIRSQYQINSFILSKDGGTLVNYSNSEKIAEVWRMPDLEN
jgi:WD40 repeat protein